MSVVPLTAVDIAALVADGEADFILVILCGNLPRTIYDHPTQRRRVLFWFRGDNHSGGHSDEFDGPPRSAEGASLGGDLGVLPQKILKNRRSLLAFERISAQKRPIF